MIDIPVKVDCIILQKIDSINVSQYKILSVLANFLNRLLLRNETELSYVVFMENTELFTLNTYLKGLKGKNKRMFESNQDYG
jgi:hypothetical protein